MQVDRVFRTLRDAGIDFFTGVPDSLLKDFCAFMTDHVSDDAHVVAANEGAAVAMAAGHYLATGRPALVYMQNSGIGNAINPLLSLADREVYAIPMLLMIGWRGEPGIPDEPQHLKQGRIMPGLLDAMEIPWFHLDPETEDPGAVIPLALAAMHEHGAPVAFLVSKGAFERHPAAAAPRAPYPLTREAAIGHVLDQLGEDDIVVSTTGMASRELFEQRVARNERHDRDFLTVGSMGHAVSIAMGIARAQERRRVICLDGDGAVLMHMGSLAIAGRSRLAGLTHVVLNNGAHDSVGGQPSVGLAINFVGIARGTGYRHAQSVSAPDELRSGLAAALASDGPRFLEIRVATGARPDLGRPTTTPIENRDAFMARLRDDPDC